jgi:hypothetical protein
MLRISIGWREIVGNEGRGQGMMRVTCESLALGFDERWMPSLRSCSMRKKVDCVVGFESSGAGLAFSDMIIDVFLGCD